MVHFYTVGPSFHFVFCRRGWIPCLHIPTPRFSPRKLSAQGQGKVFCQPLMAAPTVVTATHNRLRGHRLVVGSAELWADRSGGVQAPKGFGYPPPHHRPSKEKSPLVCAVPHPPRRPGAARLLRVPVVHFLSRKLGVRLHGRS